VQEKAFGTISWDYSNLMFDINGRTSLLHCTYWGIGGILYITYVEPLMQVLKQNLMIEQKGLKFFTTICAIFMTFNIFISCASATRQTERRRNIPPKNQFDIFLDEYYPDEYMDRIYTNKKEVA